MPQTVDVFMGGYIRIPAFLFFRHSVAACEAFLAGRRREAVGGSIFAGPTFGLGLDDTFCSTRVPAL